MAKTRPIVTKEMLADWKENPVTVEYFEGIKFKIRVLESDTSLGQILDYDNPPGTAMRIAKIVGHMEGLRDALEVELETGEF